mmetsp:Transcript_30358/g.72757  ORF Transcript_30358/g.72757 Transcript_30358/m.72757 type:complete len:377 (-) Transcript_30358:3803-4933(-)
MFIDVNHTKAVNAMVARIFFDHNVHNGLPAIEGVPMGSSIVEKGNPSFKNHLSGIEEIVVVFRILIDIRMEVVDQRFGMAKVETRRRSRRAFTPSTDTPNILIHGNESWSSSTGSSRKLVTAMLEEAALDVGQIGIGVGTFENSFGRDSRRGPIKFGGQWSNSKGGTLGLAEVALITFLNEPFDFSWNLNRRPSFVSSLRISIFSIGLRPGHRNLDFRDSLRTSFRIHATNAVPNAIGFLLIEHIPVHFSKSLIVISHCLFSIGSKFRITIVSVIETGGLTIDFGLSKGRRNLLQSRWDLTTEVGKRLTEMIIGRKGSATATGATSVNQQFNFGFSEGKFGRIPVALGQTTLFSSISGTIGQDAINLLSKTVIRLF